MIDVPVVILGCGIAGLGVAYRAKEKNIDAIIFEAKSEAGGLLNNFEIEGFRFDNAVHLSFATEEKVREIFDRTEYYTHSAESLCFEEGIWLKHPVQNNLFPLPIDDKIELVTSFIKRTEKLDSQNYEAWLRSQYGDRIAERYPIRYTKKYWDTAPKNMSTEWIGNRMRRAELTEILYGSYTEKTPNYYYTKEMRYPKRGGFKSFIEPLIQNARVEYNSTAVRIDPDSKQVFMDNGTVVKYKKLISTIPLPEVIKIVDGAPVDILDAALLLKATSIDLISIGFKKHVETPLWFYIYDDDIYASRAYSPSIKSPNNAPLNKSSLQFEIYTRGTSSKYKSEDLINNTIYALEKLNIASASDIEITDHRRIKYGNVIFDEGMAKNREIVRGYLKKAGIETCGRFGEWDYLWSNQSFLSGYNSLIENSYD